MPKADLSEERAVYPGKLYPTITLIKQTDLEVNLKRTQTKRQILEPVYP